MLDYSCDLPLSMWVTEYFLSSYFCIPLKTKILFYFVSITFLFKYLINSETKMEEIYLVYNLYSLILTRDHQYSTTAPTCTLTSQLYLMSTWTHLACCLITDTWRVVRPLPFTASIAFVVFFSISSRTSGRSLQSQTADVQSYSLTEPSSPADGQKRIAVRRIGEKWSERQQREKSSTNLDHIWDCTL